MGAPGLRRLCYLRRAARIDTRTHCLSSVRKPRPFGRIPGFNISLRPIIAASEGAAWDKANRILAAMTGDMTGKKGWSRQDRLPDLSTMPGGG